MIQSRDTVIVGDGLYLIALGIITVFGNHPACVYMKTHAIIGVIDVLGAMLIRIRLGDKVVVVVILIGGCEL